MMAYIFCDEEQLSEAAQRIQARLEETDGEALDPEAVKRATRLMIERAVSGILECSEHFAFVGESGRFFDRTLVRELARSDSQMSGVKV
jgi:hypothetical protein